MNSEEKTKGTLYDNVELFVNTLNHIFIGFNSIFMTYFCIKTGLKNISLHAWLCTIGYQFLMGQAILSLYSKNSWTSLNSRRYKTTAHWILQVAACTFAITGAALEINAKSVHFKSVHGILGLVATILLCIGLISGLGALFSYDLRQFLKPVLNKSFHIFIGLAGFVIGMTALYFGYEKGFIRRSKIDAPADVLKAFTVLSIILTSFGPLRTLFHQVRERIF